MVTIRPVQLPADRAQILALDRSYRIARTPLSFVLEEIPVHPPRHKEFPLAGNLEGGRAGEHALVAEHHGAIVGFTALTHQFWNRRTELWHLYVAPAMRRRGVGRALVEAVIATARAADMRCVWLETSTLAYPAIQFYRHMGFELCGLDESLYDQAGVSEGETTLFFARWAHKADQPNWRGQS